ncbi:hypothetical protein RZN22_14570 [Bacillaceae bacterium S4-13-58]
MFIVWTLAIGVGLYTLRFGQYLRKEGNRTGGMAVWILAVMSMTAPILLHIFNVFI